MEQEIDKMMLPHADYITEVAEGRTPFRNYDHCINVLSAPKMNLNLTPE